jgi:lysine 2,3-aminomutase
MDDNTLVQNLRIEPVSVDSSDGSSVEEDPWPVGEASNKFRKRFYSHVSLADWNDWRWQTRQRLRSYDGLDRIFQLSDDEREGIREHKGALPAGITPYYASLMGLDDADEPLRRTHVPVKNEFLRTPGEADDPLGEDHDTSVPGLVHRYPDRVLLLTTSFCSTYCRYCTRARAVGQ